MDNYYENKFAYYSRIVMMIILSIEFILNIIFLAIITDINSQVSILDLAEEKVFKFHKDCISATFSLFFISYFVFVLELIAYCGCCMKTNCIENCEIIFRKLNHLIILTTFLICQFLYFTQSMIIPVFLHRAKNLVFEDLGVKLNEESGEEFDEKWGIEWDRDWYDNLYKKYIDVKDILDKYEKFEENIDKINSIKKKYSAMTALCIIFLVFIIFLDFIVINLYKSICCQMEIICQNTHNCMENFGRWFIDKISCICCIDSKDKNIIQLEEVKNQKDIEIFNLNGEIRNLMAQNMEINIKDYK